MKKLFIYLIILLSASCSKSQSYCLLPALAPLEVPNNWTNIHFDRTGKITNDGNNVWIPDAAESWNPYARSSALFKGDGHIRMRRIGLARNTIIGLDVDTASPTFPYHEVAAYLSTSGGIQYQDGNNTGYVSAGVSIAVGDYVAIYRSGSTFKLQTSTDGNTWTDVHTFTYTSSADMVIVMNVNSDGIGYYPQRDNVYKNIFVLHGDSYGVGVAASDVAHRWFTLFCANKNAVEYNMSYSGMAMQPACTGPVFDATHTPPYNDTLYAGLIFAIGINDIAFDNGSQTTAAYKTYYKAAIDDAIGKGWPLDRIVILTPYYVLSYGIAAGACGGTVTPPSNETRHIAYNNIVKVDLVADYPGIKMIDMYAAQAAVVNSSYFDADLLHPNNAGHLLISQIMDDRVVACTSKIGGFIIK
jgi:hypothetical protein